MALIACGECGKEISDKAPACPHCGAPSESTPAKSIGGPAPQPPPGSGSGGGIWKWVVGVPVAGFVAFMVFGAVAGNSPEGKERTGQRRAIELCWDMLNDKRGLDPSAVTMASATCSKMEGEYRSRWGREP